MSAGTDTGEGMETDRRGVAVVLSLLLLLTAVALWFTGVGARELLSARGAAAAAACLAFVKAWFVAMDFMELRGTRWQAVFTGWLALVAVVSLVLILR